jgi:hypothetical protein
MPTAIVLPLLFGLFTEERVPAKGYACLNVRYRGVVYAATRLERTRLTGNVTLTLPAPVDPLDALLGKPPGKGRVVQLSGYDAVVDSLTCTCHESWRLSGRCVDR